MCVDAKGGYRNTLSVHPDAMLSLKKRDSVDFAGACCRPQVAELEVVTVLGAGAFGQVTLVKHGGRYYALKTLAKMHIVQTGLTVRTSRRALC